MSRTGVFVVFQVSFVALEAWLHFWPAVAVVGALCAFSLRNALKAAEYHGAIKELQRLRRYGIRA